MVTFYFLCLTVTVLTILYFALGRLGTIVVLRLIFGVLSALISFLLYEIGILIYKMSRLCEKGMNRIADCFIRVSNYFDAFAEKRQKELEQIRDEYFGE